jgi:predicted porin
MLRDGKVWGCCCALLGSVALLSAGPANAENYADLEERIAELEATTARKGNRKLSLEISGQINQGILYWDDGGESNAYIVTNENSRSRFRFKGKAKINADWEAGYLIEVGIRTANSKRFTQDNDRGDGNPADVGFDLRDAVWYLKSKTLGRGWVGLTASSTDQITEINQTQTSVFSKYSDIEDSGLGLFLRSSTNGGLSNLTWRRLIGDGGDQPGDGDRKYNQVKYESPEIAGFTASATWGEDDFWDMALRYSGEIGPFKIAAGIGYGEQLDGTDTNISCNATIAGNQDCHQFGGSISVIHDPTGLFVNFGAGTKTDELIEDTARFAGTGVDDGQEFWAIQGGIERKFFDVGKTTLYGEYYNYDGGGNSRRTIEAGDPINPFGGDAAIWATGVESFGAGVAQGFDNAALIVYLQYRHVEADLALRQLAGGVAAGPVADAQLDDLDIVFTGAIIKF